MSRRRVRPPAADAYSLEQYAARNVTSSAEFAANQRRTTVRRSVLGAFAALQVAFARDPPDLASPFRDPFPGHLPGYLAESERTSPGRPDPEAYNQFLVERWQALLDSEDSRDESLLQTFLERHP